MPQVQATARWDWESRRHIDALAFPEEEYAARIERLREEMRDGGLTHLIAYSNHADPGNVRWLSGFYTSYGESIVVVSLEREPMLVTNWVMHSEPMHSGIYHSWMKDTRVCPMGSDDIAEEVAEAINPSASNLTIGLAGQRMVPHRIVAKLAVALGVDEFADGDQALAAARRIKSAREIEMMRRAAQITGAGLAAALAACVPGVTEQTVMGIAHGAMFSAGAEHLAFDTAVASGPVRAGMKHCTPTWRTLESGDMVFLDMGATHHGYYADVSRCAIVGDPTPESLRLMVAAENLFAELSQLGRPGKSVVEWHEDGLRIASELGFADHYKRGGFGHGLGCMVYERPNLRYGPNPEVLETGMTFAFEPMFVIGGLGTGVVEDTMLVTESGLESLSGLPTRTYSR